MWAAARFAVLLAITAVFVLLAITAVFAQQPQPQISGGQAGFEGGERDRFPRRRRRPHGPRPDGMAAPVAAPSDDFNPGNE